VPILGRVLEPPAPPETPSITWTAPDGTVTGFTAAGGTGITVIPGLRGLDMPILNHYIDEAPALDGGVWQGVRISPRDVFVPVAILDDTRAGALAQRRRLTQLLNPQRGVGTLTVAESDGTRRHLDCVYVEGMEGSEGSDEAGLTWITYGLRFAAIDRPYWYGDPAPSRTWTVAAPINFFPLDVPPFVLSSSQVIGAAAVDNLGDVPTYTQWVIDGPATAVTLALGSEEFTVNHTLTGGQSIHIDFDPREQTVTDGAGVNLWADVAAGFVMWALPPGGSTVTLTVAGSSTGTQVTMTYQPLYLTA
jgi:hypothetical protein